MVNHLRTADVDLLDHVVRYRLTTPAIARSTGLLGDVSEAAAQEQLLRLARDGWLAEGRLTSEDATVPCFQATVRTAQKLGHAPAVAKPLGRERCLECFAIAAFCCGGAFRQLLTKPEFTARFPALWRPGLPMRFYLEPENSPTRLAFLKFDGRGRGQWDRLIDSCARFVRQRTDERRVAPEFKPQAQAFADLVRRERFQFSVLTACLEKSRAIEFELARRQAAGEPAPSIQAYVVPRLFELMFPAPAVIGE